MTTADASEAMARFCHAHLALLEAEQANEAAFSTASLQHLGKKELERRALAVCQLQIAGSRTGFGGKVLLELERAAGTALKDGDAGGRVPISQILRSGDLVRVERQLSGSASKELLIEATAQAVQGVVTKAQEHSLVIALSQEVTETPAQGTPVWCVKLANTVTYERMRRQVQDLLKQADNLDEAGNLVRVLIQGEEPAAIHQQDLDITLQFFDEGLNGPQQQAVKHALAAPELALIHGPPGTGKTSTLVEIIRHLVARGLRPLVCAPSNIAVDNLAERLATAGVPLIRIGHPARLLPAVVNHALDVVVAQSDNAALVRDLRNELDGNLQQMAKVKLGRHAPVNGPAAGGKDKKRALYLANKDLRRDLRQRERVCVTQVLHEARVVLATLHGAGSRVLSSQRFDVVVIDEAAQALEPQCWIAMRRARKVILAGDPLQLPPVIKTDDVAGMLKAYHAQAQTTRAEQAENKAPVPLLTGATPEATLLGRLLKRFGKQEQNPGVVSFLSVQYRMHADICRFPSQELYEGRLVPPDPSTSTVGVHLLRDLPGVRDTDETSVPLVLIDTQGFDLFEEVEDDPTASKANRAECGLIKTHVDRLLDAGVPVEEVAVLTPYSAQVACLADLFFNRDDTSKDKSTDRDYTGLELGTVDGMQGREKEAVLLTLVRSQPLAHHARNDGKSQSAGVGFLKEARRLNVAMTRARRHLAVVGDAETVGAGGGFLARWMTFLSEQGDLRFPET